MPGPTPSPLLAETSLEWPAYVTLTTDGNETPGPTPQPLPAVSPSSESPASLPYAPDVPQTFDLPFLLIAESFAPSLSPQTSPETPNTQVSTAVINGSAESRYVCGDGIDGDESTTTVEVTFDYDLYNKIEIAVGEALRDVKESILSDIAGRMGCNRVFWTKRRLVAEFKNIIGLTSHAQDLPDPNALGCVVHIETDEPTICTPVSGGFTVSSKPGTSTALLEQTSTSLKTIIREGMDSGLYESEIMQKAVYIGDREGNSKARASAPPENTQAHVNKSSNKKLIGAVIGLALACLLLICLLCLHVKRARRDRRTDRYGGDEEVELGKYSGNISRTRRTLDWSNMVPEIGDYLAGPQRRTVTSPRSVNLRSASQRAYPSHWPKKDTSLGRQNKGSPFEMSEKKNSHVSLEGGSDSSGSSDSSDSGSPSELTGDTSECDRANDVEVKVPVTFGDADDNTFHNDERQSNVQSIPTGYKESVDTPKSNPSYDKEERKKRLEHARARAAQRKSLGL